jgi:transposase InsO family protein
VYDDIPHVARLQPKKPPGPHPYKASQPHQYWFIDGRMMDFAFDGVKWWSILILDGYSRTILAGALAPSEASWATLMVLYTACARYGAPQTLISDSGGAYIAKEFEAVCTRLEIDHPTIVSTQGESYIDGNALQYSAALIRLPVFLESKPWGVGTDPSSLHPDVQYDCPPGTAQRRL